MAKKLPWSIDFTTNDLVINWEDDIYNGFPFLNLKDNGLSMKQLNDLTAPDDNMVRGIAKSGSRSVDGLVSQKLVGLRGSLQYGWDRTSWPIPFMFVNGENQIFDRRHTYHVLQERAKECTNISEVPTAEYVRVKSKLGGIINKFSDASIQMMAAMWGNVYGPISDDTKDHQFVGSITKILRQEQVFLSASKNTIFTIDVIKDVFKYMGGEDRYPNDSRTQTRIINGVYDNVHEKKKTSSSGTPCINNNIDAYEAFIKDDSNEWLKNNKVDKISNTVYRNYVISSNTYHITDAVRRLLKSICAEEQSKDPRTTKVLLYNEKESDQSEKIEKSRENFENSLAELYYPIRDAALNPVEKIINKDIIPRKSLNDFDLEVYAMHQIEGEEEPVKLTFPDNVVKKSS
tara:strand:+ start:190 stop:1395 length:1206 start_codon:yes stop_codon:yes gene_type:complete